MLYISMDTRAKYGLEFRQYRGREYCDVSSSNNKKKLILKP